MANFLLWNVQRKPLDALVLALVEEYAVDGLFLVEHPKAGSRLRESLAGRHLTPVPCLSRFGVFFQRHFRVERPPPLGRSTRADFWQLTTPSGGEALFALFHGPDRRNCDNATRRMAFRSLADHIRYIERRVGHRRTVIAGDFNANPFESAVASADGLHALGVRRVRGRTSRKVHGEAVDFFL
jgi:hypothetical protein